VSLDGEVSLRGEEVSVGMEEASSSRTETFPSGRDALSLWERHSEAEKTPSSNEKDAFAVGVEAISSEWPGLSLGAGGFFEKNRGLWKWEAGVFNQNRDLAEQSRGVSNEETGLCE